MLGYCFCRFMRGLKQSHRRLHQHDNPKREPSSKRTYLAEGARCGSLSVAGPGAAPHRVVQEKLTDKNTD